MTETSSLAPLSITRTEFEQQKMAPSTRSTTRKAAAANPSVGPLSGPSTGAATSTDSRSDASADHPTTAGTHDDNQYTDTNGGDDNNAAGSVPDWAKSSAGAVLRTVEDDPDMTMDLNGWKNIVKDQEDMMYLKQALEDIPAADISDVEAWAQQQEQAKYNKELEAHVAAVDAAPEELKISLLARSKSG